MEITASNVDTQYLNLLENILNYGLPLIVHSTAIFEYGS